VPRAIHATARHVRYSMLTSTRQYSISHDRRNDTMMWTIALVLFVLFVLWILGFGVFHVAGGLIHILLVVAVISILWNLIARRKTV
jgi:hypothetical protein